MAGRCGAILVYHSVLFFDIDNFKKLNKRYTETKVDEKLLPEAQRLIKSLSNGRGGAYRHGGEEFVIIIPNHDQNEALVFAEKVRSAFEAHSFDAFGSRAHLTVSVGVALWPDHGVDFGSVLKAANLAEHNAKDGGRNQIKLAD
jgi:diguanylate cyclase (GGDEF)-like protein